MKATTVVTFLALATLASGRHVAPKSIVTEMVKDVIEDILPGLASIFLPSVDMGALGSMKNVSVVGIDQLSILKITSPGIFSTKIDNLTLALDFASADVAQLNFLNVELPDVGMTLNGEGSLSGNVTKIWITVAFDLELTGLTSVSMTDYRNLQVRIGAINGDITGIDSAAEISEIIRDKFPDYLSTQIPIWSEIPEIKALVLDFVNDRLSSY